MISLTVDEQIVRLEVSDDGIGFDPNQNCESGESPTWGLTTMHERAESVGGHCHIESVPGAGTQIIVEVERL